MVHLDTRSPFDELPQRTGGPLGGRAVQPDTFTGFERLFDPDQGGRRGAFGALIGSQSRQDFELGKRSQGLNTLLQSLQDDGGVNPQRVVVDFFNSQAGIQAVQNDPAFVSRAIPLIKTMLAQPSTRARAELAQQADVPVETIADLEIEKMRVDLLTTETRERIERAKQLGVDPSVLAKVDQELKQAELDDPTGSGRAFDALAERLGVTPEELGQLDLDRRTLELKQLRRRTEMSDKARERRELEREAGETPGTIAELELRKRRADLQTPEERDRAQRAEILGVTEQSLAKIDQALKEAELTDPTGSARSRKALADTLGITVQELEQINLSRKEAELKQLERRLKQSDASRERGELEAEAGVVPGTAAQRALDDRAPAVKELEQMAKLAGLGPEETKALVRRGAVAALNLETGGKTEKERAFIALIDKGLATETQAQMFLAGVVELVELPNEVGEPSGRFALINSLTGDQTPVGTGSPEDTKALRAVITGTEGQATVADPVGEPAAKPTAPPPGSQVPAEIINAGGAVSAALRLFYGVAGQVVTPTAEAALRQEQADTLKLIGTRFRDFATGDDRMLKLEAEDLKSVTDNLRLAKGPNEVGGSLLAMHNYLNIEESTIRGILTGPDQNLLADPVRVELSRSLVATKALRAQLPTEDAIKAEMVKLQSSDPLSAAEAELDTARGIVTDDGVPGALVPEGGPDLPPAAVPPPITAPGDATSDLPPAPAPGSQTQGIPEDRGDSFFEGVARFIPPAILERVREVDALMEAVDPVVGAPLEQVTNAAVGFNVALAEFIGIAPEALHEALTLMGTRGFLDEPGDAVQALKNTFEDVGFLPTPGSPSLDSFAASLGRDTFNATVASAVFLAGAPAMAARTGLPLVQFVGKTMQEFVANYPVLFAATELGAAVGPRATVAGVEAITGEDVSPELRAALEISGAFIGAAALGGFFAGTRALVKPLVSKTPFTTKPGATEEGVVNLSPLRAFAEANVEVDTLRVNAEIRRVIETFAPRALQVASAVGAATREPQKAAARLGVALRSALNGPIRKMERQKWRNADLKRDATGALPGILRWARTKRTRAGKDTKSEQIPLSAITRMEKWEVKVKGKPRTFKKRTVGDLLSLRSTFLEKIRNPKTSTQHRAFYKGAQGRILAELESQFPGNVQVQEALAFSRFLNDRFFGGALEGFMLGRTGGDFDPTAAIDALVRSVRVQGGEASTTVISEIAAKAELPGLEAASRSFIRNKFGQVAQQADAAGAREAGPEATPGQTQARGRTAAIGKGQEFLENPTVQAFSKAFPRVDAEAKFTQSRLTQVNKEQKALEDTAFSRFANVDTRTAVDKMMKSPNRVGLMRELVTRMRPVPALGGPAVNVPNEPAIASLKTGTIDWLFRGTTLDNALPSTVAARLNDQGVRQTMRMLFSSDEMRRLDRIISSAQALQHGNVSVVAKVYGKVVGTGSKIVGAALGRRLNTGTIQVPGLMAQLSSDVVSRLLGFGSLTRMMARAMVDPNMEKVLLSRDPRNLTEVREITRLMRFVQVTMADTLRLPAKEEKR